MALSSFGLDHQQKTIAPLLKPDPEDKNVSPDELIKYVKYQTSYQALNLYGVSLQQLKQLVAHNIAVVVETWFEPRPNDGMGHYQLIKGYDQSKQELYLLDSYQGPNLKLSESRFDQNWQVFNRTIVVIYPADKEELVRQILGDVTDPNLVQTRALNTAQEEIRQNPSNLFAWFNLGTTYSRMGKHQEAVQAFDQARSLKLPWRMLWYQFDIFESYLAVGRIQDVLDLTTLNLKQANNLEESLYYRAKAWLQEGKTESARRDLESATRYNKLYQPAQAELDKLKT